MGARCIARVREKHLGIFVSEVVLAYLVPCGNTSIRSYQRMNTSYARISAEDFASLVPKGCSRFARPKREALDTLEPNRLHYLYLILLFS